MAKHSDKVHTAPLFTYHLKFTRLLQAVMWVLTMRKPGDIVPFGFKADRVELLDPMEIYYVNRRIGLLGGLENCLST